MRRTNRITIRTPKSCCLGEQHRHSAIFGERVPGMMYISIHGVYNNRAYLYISTAQARRLARWFLDEPKKVSG